MRGSLTFAAAVAVLLLELSDVVHAGLIPEPQPLAARGVCNSDNCLRAMLRKEREDSVYSFCTSLLSTTLPATATAAIPTYLANCGTTSQVARVSSACPCFLASITTTATTTTTSTPTSVSTSASTPASTTVTTCPPPSTTTITLPGETSTCSADTITVTAPGTTSTVTAPGTTNTVTAPASTITVTTAGPTVTASPPAASCDQPVPDSGFEGNAPGAYPWLFAQSGAGSYAVSQSVLGGSNPWPAGSDFRPHSGRVALMLRIENPAPQGFIRFWNTFNPCGGPTAYRPRLWYATNAASAGTVTFTLRIVSVSISNPTGAPPMTLFSTRAVPAVTFNNPGAWTEVVFDVWNSPGAGTATMYLDIGIDRASTSVWLDDITVDRV